MGLIYLFARYACPNSAGWSSLVARRAHNPKVVGSNPAPATKNKRMTCGNAGHFYLRGEFSGRKMFTPQPLFGVRKRGLGSPIRRVSDAPLSILGIISRGNSGGMFSRLRGKKGEWRRQGGIAETQPASRRNGLRRAEKHRFPRAVTPPERRREGAGLSPLAVWIPWLMNIADSSGLSAFFATCRHAPQPVKTLVIEATPPHSSVGGARSN